MNYDGEFNLATGYSGGSKQWKNETWSWSDLVVKLSTEHKTSETHKQFLAANSEDRDKIKDVGGYVGGYLRGGRRKIGNVIHRQLLTLDIDFAHNKFWEDFTMQYGFAAFIHGTHKHIDSDPRYRLIIPLDREVTPDEYVAIARKIAGNIGIELFDKTTFQVNRLMFWPSTPSDIDYYYDFQDGEWCSADEVLDSYIDWTDTSLWPTAESEIKEVRDASKKQADPSEKNGMIGAFCRTYAIEEAIEKFLQSEYTPTVDGRYTYVKGSTSSGMIVYDGKFAYSHHGTDPSGGLLCNAFDLVRLHMFGHLDTGSEVQMSKKPSFKAMESFVMKDAEVKKIVAKENLQNAKYEFADGVEYDEETEENVNWMVDLETDGRGKYLSSASNINTIFAHDTKLKGLFKSNSFDTKRYIFGQVPWRKITKPEPVKNVDYSGVRNYIETIYGIAGNLKIDDSMALEFEKNSFHPVQEYLNRVKWDGKKRVDTLLIDYFGVEDNIYTREAMRKTLAGAVARIKNPGVKFDLVLTLVGEQGTGKSTFASKLGKTWFSDSFTTVVGKEAFEQIQGAWLIELAELSGLRKAEVESVKHFISKQEDTFRPAYGRVSETYKRQCIFIGTTNNTDFLNDPSGNRRFMPIDIDPCLAIRDIFTIKDTEIDNIWAEAVEIYKQGEKLYLSKEAEKIALKEQRNHSVSDERSGMIETYLDTPVPEDWDSKDIFERREYFAQHIGHTGVVRDTICLAEIWCECLGKEKKDMDKYKTREINDIIRGLEGWGKAKSTHRFKSYGIQRYFYRL